MLLALPWGTAPWHAVSLTLRYCTRTCCLLSSLTSPSSASRHWLLLVAASVILARSGLRCSAQHTSKRLFQMIVIIRRMEMCKAPTLRLKVLNKHNVHRDGNDIRNKNVYKKKEEKQKLTHNADEGSSITMQKMHTNIRHTHPVQ